MYGAYQYQVLILEQVREAMFSYLIQLIISSQNTYFPNYELHEFRLCRGAQLNWTRVAYQQFEHVTYVVVHLRSGTSPTSATT